MPTPEALQRAKAGLAAAESLILARRTGERPSVEQMVQERTLGPEERSFLVDLGITLDKADANGAFEAEAAAMLDRIAGQRSAMMVASFMAEEAARRRRETQAVERAAEDAERPPREQDQPS